MDDFELKIIHEKGPTGTEEFSSEGNSFLNIFGLDNRDLQGNYLPGGDGIIDNVGSIVNPVYGELMLPFYLYRYFSQHLHEALIILQKHISLKLFELKDYFPYQSEFVKML